MNGKILLAVALLACGGRAGAQAWAPADVRAAMAEIAAPVPAFSSAAVPPAQDGEQLDKERLAHTNTWFFLLAFKEIDEVFDKSGSLKMEDFLFWSPFDGNAARLKKARMLAQRLDDSFIKQLRAARTGKISVLDLANVLAKEGVTVRRLADVVDEGYTFLGEK